MRDDHVRQNRDVWEAWTRLHLETESDYQPEIRAFEAGASTLSAIDLEEVGEVRGRTFLHLMCHFGLDSLSWARQGARVTGLDFSTEAIAAAKRLAAAHAIDAEFLCADVYDLPASLDGQFDVVYSEGGILMWLPDLAAYVSAVARCLKPGGVFYLRDSHPFRKVIFPVEKGGDGEPRYFHYFSPGPTPIDIQGSYAQPDEATCYTVNFWTHSIGEIVTAICAAGLRIEFLHEFPKVYADLPVAVRTGPGKFEQYLLHDWAIPSTFSLRARLL